MAPSLLPVLNSTTSFWRSSLHEIDDHSSTPDLPSEVDIVIIGAGYAGASTVHHILEICKEQNLPIPSIAILEARQACSGATGRNGGHLKPDPYNRPVTIAGNHGIEAAAECAEFEAQHIPAMKKLIEDEAIDCEFVLTRCMDVLLTDDIYDKMKSGVDFLRKHDISVMKDVWFASGAQAEQISGVKGAKACFSYTAGHLYPYKLITHLLANAVRAGVNLQTHTPVSSVSPTADKDGFFTVSTKTRGSLRAQKVVYATNAYTSALLPEFTSKIVPVRGICSHIAVPATSKKPAPTLQTSYILRWGNYEYEYLIPRLDGSIVVGGGRSRYYHDKASWYDNVNDDKLIEAAKPHFDGYMQRVFHGWEDSGAEATNVWTGIMGYSSDGLPHVGTVPGRQNQFIIAGFTGHGMPQVFLSSKGIAKMVVSGASFKSTGIPRVYQASKARLDSTRNVILEGWEESQKGPPSPKL
ncbi:FAD dependent oxidoreductase [Pseudomassariella vexata]|uniref:FAD dependent oxidoreductase n=1 Tax=Pseudomassariella vexata TaxID=1141098 RepID=A0A1Y2E2H2_9PEZI|nr:FAD dependent oxidoreductase [Pseudomassariella vexata]ORY65554.1 FAD dependent oxidoreductase [Pseudomassariella vexata]